MNDTLITLTGVRRQLSAAFTLNIAQLCIRQGEIVCLLGPTGSGKTTLLRLLTGLRPPDAGSICYNAPFNDRQQPPTISMVHQRPLLLRGSVRNNLSYGLRVRGTYSSAGVDAWIEPLGLSSIARQDARTLSGGQIQLVALGRALAVDPDVLLLDEPTANLDPAYVAKVEQIVCEVQLRRKMTVVWATHNLFQARRVAHQIVFMLGGQSIEVAPTQEFYAQPSDPRSAAFVQGQMVC